MLFPFDWFRSLTSGSRAHLRLICFPYAGGGPQAFRSWPHRIKSNVEIWAVNLPGREQRISEKPTNCLAFIVENLAQRVHRTADKRLVFFGHSLGALLAFELARQLQESFGLEIAALYVSASRAPHLPGDGSKRSKMRDEALLSELKRLNGSGLAVEHSELMQLILPAIRADFELYETYKYYLGRPLLCPISAFGGLQDTEVQRAELAEWRYHTESDFDLQMFEGDHFFLHSSEIYLLRALDRRLSQIAFV